MFPGFDSSGPSSGPFARSFSAENPHNCCAPRTTEPHNKTCFDKVRILLMRRTSCRLGLSNIVIRMRACVSRACEEPVSGCLTTHISKVTHNQHFDRPRKRQTQMVRGHEGKNRKSWRKKWCGRILRCDSRLSSHGWLETHRPLLAKDSTSYTA